MKDSSFTHFSKNSEILPLAQAQVSLFDINYSYGFGVYETIRVKDTRPLFLSDHIGRLLESARLIGLDHSFLAKGITDATHTIIQKLSNPQVTAFNLKILLLGGKTSSDAVLYILPLQPLFPDRKLYQNGVSAWPVAYERWLPNAKTLNMLPSHFYYAQAKARGCYDALFIDSQGSIREGSRTNFFAIRGKTLFTPPEKHILLGVTRHHVLKVARENGYSIIENPLPLADIKTFDGVFLTSTSSKILPIRKIGDQDLPPIPQELRNLMRLFDTYLEATSS